MTHRNRSQCKQTARYTQAALGALFMSIGLQAFSAPESAEAQKQRAHDIFKQLIEINTMDSSGSTTVAAQAMAQRLRDAGFPAADVVVLGPNDRKGNMVARYRGRPGSKLKPILIIGHLDVVEARKEDWSTDPFQFVEQDGYYYGRGTQDMKDSDAIAVTNFIRLKKEGFVPDRDIILALTADEEGGTSNGVDWLLKNHRDLIDAEFALNPDSGGVWADNGKALTVEFEATEKLYGDYQLLATNAGGHSSLPRPDNAIYHVADALTKLQSSQFPFELNAVTREYFTQMARIESGQTAADMRAILQTPPDAQAIAAFVQGSALQLDHAHDLRGHHARRRSCVQRSAAARGGECQLPHLPGPFARRYPARSGEALRRSAALGTLPRGLGPALRSRLGSPGDDAAASQPGVHARAHERVAEDVAGGAGAAHHGAGRIG